MNSIFRATLYTLLFAGLTSGCGNGEVAVDNMPPEITVESISKDALVVQNERTLKSSLVELSTTLDEETFINQALTQIVDNLVVAYVPDYFVEEVKGYEFLQVSTLQANDYIVMKLKEFYAIAKVQMGGTVRASYRANSTAVNDISLTNIIAQISKKIFDYIYDYFFGEDDDSSILDTIIDWFGGSDETPPVSAVDINATTSDSGTTGTLVSEELGFSYDLLAGKTLYVVSSKADMTVTMGLDAKTGSGGMGFISMDFTDTIDADKKLLINTSLMGDWLIDMKYLDSDYCIAADAISSDGTVYESYWFLEESVMQQATTVANAKALCLKNGYVGGEAPADTTTIDESDVVPIADHRAGEEVKTGTTKEIVNQLLEEANNVAGFDDAKYFVRNLRKGILSLFSTNGKTQTVEAIEMEQISRKLMPVAGSSLLQMKDLAASAMNTTKSFTNEVQTDLNDSINTLSGRLDALAIATQNAMDAVMKDESYGTSTSSYGDKVEIAITNKNINVCLVFFLCESSVDAKVHYKVTNNGTNGNFADISLYTAINATEMNINSVKFSKVTSEQNVNSFSSDGYALDIDDFVFNKSASTLFAKGKGTLTQLTSSNSKTTAIFDSFETLLNLRQQSADVTDYAITNVNFAFDGTVATQEGRTFDGSIYFDGQSTGSNKFDGTIQGKAGEPTIAGMFKTTLSYNDISGGTNVKELSISSGLPYFKNSDGSLEVVASFYKQFDSFKADDFSHNNYTCQLVSQNSYSCTSFSGVKKTLKLTKAGEVLTIGTTQGDYFVVDIQNVNSFSSSKMQLVHTQDGSRETIDTFDYDKAQVSNVRLQSSTPSSTSVVDNYGSQSYTMDVNISYENQLIDMYLLASRDSEANMWTYVLNDVLLQNVYGSVRVDSMTVKEEGSFRFEDELTALVLGNVVGDFKLGVDGIFGLQWGDFTSIKALNIKGLDMNMTVTGNTAHVTLNTDVTNSATQVKGDINATYNYLTTQATFKSDFDVAVDSSSEAPKFTPMVTASGTIVHDLVPNYSFTLQVEDSVKYMVLTNDAIAYQQGFKIQTDASIAADAYGVQAHFTNSDDFRQIYTMDITSKEGTKLGVYDAAQDTQKVNYNDGVTEYLYIH